MKTRLLLSLLAASTGAAEDLVPPAVAPVSWVDPADPSAAPFREEGEQWTNRVGHLMVYEVERDIAERGVARAVELVHLKDLTLPTQCRASRASPR